MFRTSLMKIRAVAGFSVVYCFLLPSV